MGEFVVGQHRAAAQDFRPLDGVQHPHRARLADTNMQMLADVGIAEDIDDARRIVARMARRMGIVEHDARQLLAITAKESILVIVPGNLPKLLVRH